MSSKRRLRRPHEDVPPARKSAKYENDAEAARPPPATKKRQNEAFKLSRLPIGRKRTNDDIHTSIEICPVFQAVLDTPQVQRLKRLKQLGVAEYVYMNVTHNRFEHSLGVAHLAERMCKRLKRRQKKNLGITKKDVLCVKLAGLCHDLGHGPFSHVYDGEFISRVKKAEELFRSSGVENPYDKYPEIPDGWAHEDASLMMIDAALEHLGMKIDEANLDAPLRQIGSGIDAAYFGAYPDEFGNSNEEEKPLPIERVLTSRDWIFIKECIVGGPLPGNSDFVGRGREKEFLYDIVSNRHSGLDVDKIDYFARDQRRAHKQAGEIDHRLIDEAFVAWGKCSRPEKCFRCKHVMVNASDDDDLALQKISKKGQLKQNSEGNESRQGMHLMICYPLKVVIKAMDFFKTRFRLHEEIYYHKASKPVEFMICDILAKADLHQLIRSENYPGGLPISRAMVDAEAYSKLRDSIVDLIYNSENPALQEAQKLIKRLESRDLYKFVASQEIYGDFEVLWEKSEEEIRDELADMRTRHGEVELSLDDIIAEKREIHHGRKDCNPVSLMRFLPKREMSALKNSISHLPEAKEANEDDYRSHIPRNFNECTIRIYSRSRSPAKVELLLHTFRQWVETTKQGDNAPMCMFEVLKEDGYPDGVNEPAICSQETPVRDRYSSTAQVSAHNDELSPVRSAHAKRHLDYGDAN